MGKCFVPKCKNRSDNQNWKKNIGCVKKKIAFHRIPKDPHMRNLWLSKLKLDTFPTSKNARVCSEHFNEDCFMVPESQPTHNVLHGTQIIPQPSADEPLSRMILTIDDFDKSSSTNIISIDERITSPPASKPTRKSAHIVRTDLDSGIIEVDKLNEIPTKLNTTPTILKKRRIIKKNNDTPTKLDVIPTTSIKNRTRIIKKHSNNQTASNPPKDIRCIPPVEISTLEINKNDGCEQNNDSQSLETKLHLAEFRIAQYRTAVEHLQNRLEASISELTELKEKRRKDAEYYYEELNSRNRKIIQLETENRSLLENLSSKIIKVEDSVQNEKEERILGY